uniref:Uncharacterized protein n=1 Tax=Lotus japonicus TaxID=34305 RepID=I3SPP0_LOTJA|nr:unknown [Lotus japonicus]
MADTGGRGEISVGAGACDNKCGCTVPCAGGSTCRCTSGGGARGGVEHLTCSCGEHCECNPCSCPKTVAAGTGCSCDASCTCASCRT